MARYLALTSRRGGTVALAVVVGLVVEFVGTTRAQNPAPVPVPAKVPPAPIPAAPKPATNAAPVAPPVQDSVGRYGPILAPGDEPSHPFKLKMGFANAGELKLPKPDELVMRKKLEELAKLSDDEIRKQLLAWPAFSKMNLHDEGALLQRIQDFRNYRTTVAMQKARDMGLLSTLTPDQKTKFEKDYWDQRLKLDEELEKQFLPIYQAREQKLEDELFREFSSAAPAPKPAPPPPMKPFVPGPSPTNGAPIAQAPH